jgi:hypothetical protein
MIISKCGTLVFAAVALAGCCLSGTCYAPLPETPTAWDGLGSAPTETSQATEHRPQKRARPKKEIILGPIADVPAEAESHKLQGKDAWEQQEAEDRDADAKLNRQLKICRDC